MKIGILTFHYCYNQGAVLQAFSLLTFLRRQGYDAELIDYKLNILTQRYHILSPIRKIVENNYPAISKIKRIISTLLFTVSRKIKFENFKNNNLIIGRSDTNSYDHIFIGSDQVWNTVITAGYNNYYWGRFNRNSSCKLHSYAASCIAEVDLEDSSRVCKDLSKFANISVREKSVYDKLVSLNIKNVVVLDPVFLLEKEDWNRHTKKDSTSYIYEYNILGIDYSKDIVEILKQKTGISNTKHMVSNSCKISYSPFEFISVIKNSNYVVTSSFHGLAFSIIFEVPFLLIKSGTPKDERALSLLSLVGLENRAICSVSDINRVDMAIDWNKVRKKLKEKRDFSIEFINNCLK